MKAREHIMFSDWVGITAGIAGILVGLAGAVAYFKANVGTGTIAAYAASSAAMKEELEIYKSRSERLDKEREELAGRVLILEGQVQTLTGLLTQRADVERLATETLKQHLEVITELKSIADILVKPGRSS